MSTLTAQLVQACEHDLGMKTPSSMPDARQLSYTEFASQYFLYNLVRKLEPWEEKADVPKEVLQASLEKFVDTEWRCTVINRHGRFYSPIDETKRAFFREAIRLARSWISRTTMDRWPAWSDARYTSGASVETERKQSMSYLKWAGHSQSGAMSATTAALHIVTNYIAPEYGPSWAYARVKRCDHSRFDFVSKTAKAVRFMAMEAEYNMLAQKCVGDCIRGSLLEVGYNLNAQTLNQELARWASISQNQGTVDMSNSSDNHALRLHEMLLPERLWHYCVTTRTPNIAVDGVKHKLEKTASMGNGFIFELQSLIYAGLAHAATQLTGGRESDIAVYGDDIIVSTQTVEPFLELLEYLGMEPNWEKSYWGDTPFRESCGTHWYAGRDVTPFYVKEPLGTLATRFRALNGIDYWSERTGIALPTARRLLIAAIDRRDRVVVPKTWSITSGLHFLCSGCKPPTRRVAHGEIYYRQKALTEPVIDIRDRLDDEVLYRDWLASPPEYYVEPSVFHRLDALRKRRDPRGFVASYGCPRERKAYSSVWDSASCSMLWAEREFRLGDAS
ncbi:MAG: putative replicase protein [Leviviridae sp.]|nr:MAG: putative replicase protein [Leviviridae sp.]